MSQAHAISWAPRRRRIPRLTLRLFVAVLFGVTVLLPVGLIVLLRYVPPPATPLMMRYRGRVTQNWVPLHAISPNLVRAVIAAEDDNFCFHDGFDWRAIGKARESNAAGKRLRGASTISQQTAKNLFLLPDRTWTRKSIEAYLTVLLEALWPKRRILETYLNIAEWGPGRVGAEAAAKANFGKSAWQLTALEAARLATILPNPRQYRADVPGPFVLRQSELIVARMAEVTRDKLDACVDQ
jgi:monofunctional biosynthetic peptidoglycan transglycosylase